VGKCHEPVRCRGFPAATSLALPHGASTAYPDAVATREELEQLSSKELHHRALRLAERRLDVGFLWRLIKTIPAAEAAAGNLQEARADIAVGDLVPLLSDLSHADEGELADALRPVYIDYLEKHGR
jgi:hypothetical protein